MGDKASSINSNRFKLPKEIGFEWKARCEEAHEATWRENLEKLREFQAKFGHCTVSLRDKPNKQLAVWVQYQRRHYKLSQMGKRSSMNPKRVKLLNEMGFKWKLGKG